MSAKTAKGKKCAVFAIIQYLARQVVYILHKSKYHESNEQPPLCTSNCICCKEVLQQTPSKPRYIPN